jgi:mono/diheme cytochrome c family protein
MKTVCRSLVSLIILPALTACADEPSPKAVSQAQDVATGAQLFVSLCASCHGEKARGDGPVAPFLTRPPTDLTRLAQRNNGFFMADKIHQVIDGRLDVMFHGPREMPVWGRRLSLGTSPNDAAAQARADTQISLLVEYIRSIQQL